MAMCGALSAALRRGLGTGMPSVMHGQCEAIVMEMGGMAGGCERILSTPIPLSYTRQGVYQY